MSEGQHGSGFPIVGLLGLVVMAGLAGLFFFSASAPTSAVPAVKSVPLPSPGPGNGSPMLEEGETDDSAPAENTGTESDPATETNEAEAE